MKQWNLDNLVLHLRKFRSPFFQREMSHVSGYLPQHYRVTDDGKGRVILERIAPTRLGEARGDRWSFHPDARPDSMLRSLTGG